MKKILFLDARIPARNQDSGSIDAFNYMQCLVGEGYEVTFACYWPRQNHLQYASELMGIGVTVMDMPFQDQGVIDSWVKSSAPDFDAIIISRPELAERLLGGDASWRGGAKLIYNTVDIHHLRLMKQAAHENSAELGAMAEKVKATEFNAFRLANLIVVVSTSERDYLVASGIAPENIAVWPLLRKAPGRNGGFRQRRDCLFIGGYSHTPNRDAVGFLVNEIWPKVTELDPSIRLIVAGSDMPQDWKALKIEGVDFLGFVADEQELFDSVRYSIAPLRFGAGLKGKIVSSLSFGVPVISSRIGAEGFPDGGGLVVPGTEDALGFARAIVDSYSDEDVWNGLSKDGLVTFTREFSYEKIARTISTDFARLFLTESVVRVLKKLRDDVANVCLRAGLNFKSAYAATRTAGLVREILARAQDAATESGLSIPSMLHMVHQAAQWQVLVALGEFYRGKGVHGSAAYYAECALATNHFDLHAQDVRFSALDGLLGGSYRSDTERFLLESACDRPGGWMEITGTDTWACCSSWLPVPTGTRMNLKEEARNPVRLELIDSVRRGEFNYCSRLHCPFIASRKLPRKGQSADVAHSRTFNLSYDEACNLACPSCRTDFIKNSPDRKDALNAYFEGEILPNIRPGDYVNITGSGDPFYSAHFRWVIERLRDHAGVFIDIQTNGVLANEANCEKLFETKLNQVWVSIDAATQATYDKIRVGGDYRRLLKNLLNFVDLRDRGRVATVGLDFVVQQENLGEATSVVALAKSIGLDKVRFNMIRNWGTFSPEEFFVKCPGLTFSPFNREFRKVFSDPLMNDPMVDLGNIPAYLMSNLPRRAASSVLHT